MDLKRELRDFEPYVGSIQDSEEDLNHYGTPRHSGRYPWGSGENPYQRYKNFYGYVTEQKKLGKTMQEIADSMEMTRDVLQARLSMASSEIYKENVAQYRKLKEKGWSTSAIARYLDKNESTVRGYENEETLRNRTAASATAAMIKEEVDKYKYVDVGKGIGRNLGISETKKDYAVVALLDTGEYELVEASARLTKDKQNVRIQVLVPKGTTKKEVYEHLGELRIPNQDHYTEDRGETWSKIEPPVVVKKDRIFINYTDENGRGGANKDGVIELRRGVDDISLGKAQYAQVRIAVEGDQYMKGMAVYSDSIPDGYDIVYNTNKTVAQASKVFKNMNRNDKDEVDMANPFSAAIKTDDDPNSETRNLKLAQRHYIDANGVKHQSAINIVNEEGDWENWGRTLSSQLLSKQPKALAKQQLKIVYDRKMDEFNEILGLTNPTIKKELLKEFADSCDSAAVHLKAAAIPGSASHVILPVLSLKPNEIFAPGYADGSRVALVRYPHGGTFEIPDLIVNNRNREAIKMIGKDSPDAVCINPKVAQKLSGADFDGDTVTVIPNDSGRIISSPQLKGLVDYEPKIKYARSDDDPIKTGKPKNLSDKAKYKYDNFDTQGEMGKVSNLITDMTIKGANPDEICRAVRHSMTVIDAEKHNLDWKQSYKDNGIAELKARYQGITDRGQLKGASTLISKAKSRYDIPEVKAGEWRVDAEHPKGHRVFFDPDTGEKLYQETGKTHKVFKTLKNGTVKESIVPNTTQTTKMAWAKDAYELSSGQPIESVYADHANRLKALANRARKETFSIQDIQYNPSAYKIYSAEVASLKAKLNTAEKNKPFERKARVYAENLFKMRLEDDPSLEMDKDKKRKVRAQCLEFARKETGAKKKVVRFTDREWEAIQAGAVHRTTLLNLIANCNKDELKQRSMPRTWNAMSPAKQARVRQMIKNGSTILEVAQAMGVSKTTITNILYKDNDED